MKLLKSLALVVAAALMMTACGGGGGSSASPSDVAKKFMQATMEFDFAKAKQYVSKNYQAAFDEAMAQLNEPEMKAQMEMVKSIMQNVEINVSNERINGDNATVTVKFSIMGQENEDDMHLIKEDGGWKINEGPKM